MFIYSTPQSTSLCEFDQPTISADEREAIVNTNQGYNQEILKRIPSFINYGKLKKITISNLMY